MSTKPSVESGDACAPSRVWLGRHAFVAAAEAFPPGLNQRPGVTLLLGRQAPLAVEVLGDGVRYGWAVLLEPERRRRFVGIQPHYSVTVEPGHALYTSYLAWARQVSASAAISASLACTVQRDLLDEVECLSTSTALDKWLAHVLHKYGVPRHEPDTSLDALLALLATLDMGELTAEGVWSTFRQGRAGDQAYWSHWLQAQLGISLRSLLLWRKLRRALEATAGQRHATTIAHASGFADSAHLSRVCLRTFGLRPRDVQDRKSLQVVLLTPR